MDDTKLAAPVARERESARAEVDVDSTAVRHTLRRAARIGGYTWLTFTLLDAYMCVVLYPGAPLPMFLVYRLVVEALIVWLYVRSGNPAESAVVLARWQNALFFLAAIAIALMALHLGGTTSPYMHGISIVALVRAAVVPEPWRRSYPTFATIGLVFPVTMGIAGIVSTEARAAWFGADALAVFGGNYVFVLASSLVGMASGHAMWTARQQVYRARRLGRYRLQARIGKGAMGDVWLAWDASLRRNVALKILRTDGPADPEAVRRFEREARSASRLRVPHTIQVYDFGASDDGVYFIAMEYLEGVDLRQLVAHCGPLPAARVVHFALQACASLSEAHDAGVIHRDIKPQNLFVTRVGIDSDYLKLLDFGIARLQRADETLQMTQAGTVFGTPAYLAPELWRGRQADARSDIYALGATIYVLLTGVAPFEPLTGSDLIRAHLDTTPVAPSARRGEPLPASLDALVLCCLAKEPERRFASVRELAAALGEVPLATAWTGDDARAFWAHARTVGLSLPSESA